VDARQVIFEVEEAGCESCAGRVRAALSTATAVDAIDVDHDTNSATVRVSATPTLTKDEVGRLLETASHGSGHAYRLKPGSWRVES
jgi:copper chaperone CopZ